jgi:hypothetical protein
VAVQGCSEVTEFSRQGNPLARASNLGGFGLVLVALSFVGLFGVLPGLLGTNPRGIRLGEQVCHSPHSRS